ncbi:MAG TPA: ethylbenzene dehydrogenase-related protein [Burkholderiaceae bacterium]
MNVRNLKNFLMVLCLSVVAACVTVSASAATNGPAQDKTIRVLSAAGANASSPQAAIWKKAPATKVTLQPAFPGHVSIVGTPVTQEVTVQAVRAGARLFVKLAWSDPTANTAVKDTNQFFDAAAVQFPMNGQPTTLQFMGDAEHAVNIWRWRADGRTENLQAYGFGTATPVPSGGLRSTSVRSRDGWEVVIARPLGVKPEEGVDLRDRPTIPVAFAVWDGANQERDGLKAVTLEWWQLQF